MCCAVTRKYDKVPQPKHVRLRHFLLGVMKLKDVFSVLLCLGCLPFYFCHLFSLNFCDEICFTKNNKLSCLSCCSVLLQHVCCFGFILYPPRSPQEVWRVWWVASCFWVRESGMQWCELQCFSILLLCFWPMNGLTSEYIDSCARELGAKRLCLQMPWEQSHANTVLGGKPKPLIPVPDWVDFPLQLFDHAAAISRPTRLDRFNTKLHLSEVSWVASQNKRLNVALQCWKVIVLWSTCHSDFGKLLMQCIELGRSDDYVWQVISDAFSNKSAATLKARSASLLSFGRWKRISYPGSMGGIFPITEEMAYDYLCDLRATKAAPSKGTRFLEALGFSKGLIGADVDSILKSARVKGVAYGQSHKATRKKSPLTVQQVVLLERLATFGNGQEAVFAGYLCFLVHCRLRWSDGQHCIKEPQLDVTNGKGFLEAALYHHKTAQKRRTKVVRLLPVAGVLPGVSGCDWATHWLKKRAEMGLRASMQEPTMPAPMSGGGWTRQLCLLQKPACGCVSCYNLGHPRTSRTLQLTHQRRQCFLGCRSQTWIYHFEGWLGTILPLVTRVPWNIQGMLLLQCSDRSKPFSLQ